MLPSAKLDPPRLRHHTPGGRFVVSKPAVPALMSRRSTLPKRLQPMLATLTDAPFDDAAWIFEDKFDGFRVVSEIRRGKVALYSRNGKIISQSYSEVAKSLESVKDDAVIDGELVAIGKDGVSHFREICGDCLNFGYAGFGVMGFAHHAA